MSKRLYTYYHIAILALTICLAGCNTDVEICYDVHPLRAYIDFQYNWEGYAKIPDSMRVIAYRRINALKYQMMTTTRPSNNVGYVIYPSEEIGENKAGNTPLWLRGGEYELLAFSGIPDILSDETYAFFNNDLDELDSIRLKYKFYQYPTDTPLLSEYEDWIDSNPYSGYIADSEEPIYIAKKNLYVPNEKHNKHIECSFTPRPANSQKVNVEFVINPKEDGIVIDYVHAEMAGIASEIILGTGVVTTANTGKILFNPQCSPTGSAAASVTVKGSFYATGIVRSTNKSKVVGPGILQLNVHAHITQTIGGKDVTQAKTFRANINLYNTLTAKPSLIYDETKKGFVQSSKEITLSIGQALEITRDKVLATPESSLDYWVDAGTPVVIDM